MTDHYEDIFEALLFLQRALHNAGGPTAEIAEIRLRPNSRRCHELERSLKMSPKYIRDVWVTLEEQAKAPPNTLAKIGDVLITQTRLI